MGINYTILKQGEHLKKIITAMRKFNKPNYRVFVETDDWYFLTRVKEIIDKQTKCEVFPFDKVNAGLPEIIVGTDKIHYINKL